MNPPGKSLISAIFFGNRQRPARPVQATTTVPLSLIQSAFRPDATLASAPVQTGTAPVTQQRFDTLTGSAPHNFNDEMHASLQAAQLGWRERGDPYWDGGRPLGFEDKTPGAKGTSDVRRAQRMAPRFK